jgi:hypothetical protein
MDRQKELCVGILLGVTLFKFQYALPIALLFFIWRRWRFLAGFALSCAVVTGLSFWLLGYSGVLSYLHFLPGASWKFSAANDALLGIHPEGMPNLRGLSYAFSGGSVSITNVVTIISSFLVLVWAARRRPSLPGALLAALLVSFHQMISDASLLVLPVGLVLAGAMAPGRTREEKIAAAFASVAAVMPTFLLFAGTRFYLLALPVLGLFVFWDWPAASPKNGVISTLRPQTETNLTPQRFDKKVTRADESIKTVESARYDTS